MKPAPTIDRVLPALRLAPMSIADLTRCLCLSREPVRLAIDVLRATGEIHEAPPIRARRHGHLTARFAA